MLSWSITFLVIGLIAGLLGLSGIAGAATQIAWILFVVFLVLFLVSLVMGRRSPPGLTFNYMSDLKQWSGGYGLAAGPASGCCVNRHCLFDLHSSYLSQGKMKAPSDLYSKVSRLAP